MKYLKYILLLVIAGVITGFYMYNKPVKKTGDRDVDITIKAEDLLSAFEQHENEANAKYLDKVIAVSGTISAISVEEGIDAITLKAGDSMAGIVCKMEKGETDGKALKVGDDVKVKGVCTGMLMDVIMIRCVVE